MWAVATDLIHWVVCLVYMCWSHSWVCKNGWTVEDDVWRGEVRQTGTMEPCTRWGYTWVPLGEHNWTILAQWQCMLLLQLLWQLVIKITTIGCMEMMKVIVLRKTVVSSLYSRCTSCSITACGQQNCSNKIFWFFTGLPADTGWTLADQNSVGFGIDGCLCFVCSYGRLCVHTVRKLSRHA